MRSKSRSLRVKLTLWFLLVFSVLQLTLLGGIAVLKAPELRESARAELAKTASDMVESQVITDPLLEQGDLGRYVPVGGAIRAAIVRDERGGILASWQLPEGAELPFTSWEVVLTGPLGAVFTPLSDDEAQPFGASSQLQVLTFPYRALGEPRYLQVVVAESWPRWLAGPLRDLLLVGVPAGTIAALVAAWIIAGRAVAPIRKLSDAARDVSPERLSDRIQVRTSYDEISKLQHELNAALERLEAGYRAQEKFISNVSHELKTPIAVLLTEAQVVRSGASTAERDDFVRRVEDEMRGLGRLVESFLQIAGAGMGGRPMFEPVALHDLLLDAVESSAALAAGRRVALVSHIDESAGAVPDARVSGDAVLLRTMLDNLIRNAVRYSPRGAPVRVELRCDRSFARYAVRDLGPGIPEEAHDQVFARFVRLPREGDDEGGTGVGLAIAAQIAELHGGRIELSNAEEGGCVFVVELPLETQGPDGGRSGETSSSM